MAGGIVSRSIHRVRKIFGKVPASGVLSPKQEAHLRDQLKECAAGSGGEVSTRIRAARLSETYRGLGDEGRKTFLRMIASEFSPDPAAVQKAHADYQKAIGTDAQWVMESALRAALRSRRLRILTQFNALSKGVKFLVDMRADLLRFMEKDAALRSLDHELESRMTAWFDVGFLELQRISWSSPAALLEKLIQYEAVHEIRSWKDLKNRLDSDRRCYAFFHPCIPLEPLIFVEVALSVELADNVQVLLDENEPVLDPQKARTAIFYSISNTQDGLRGVSFGNFLLKRVLDDLKRDYPNLVRFATLSPLPTLRHWAEKTPEAWAQAFTPAQLQRLARHAPKLASADDVRKLLADDAWAKDEPLARALQPGLTRLVARYILLAKRGPKPYDPVARFHLSNGARIERINYLADTSARGMKQSYGVMVNYLYDPDAIEANVEAFTLEGVVAASSPVRRAAHD
jgi:malonyl-CoA decarboxylase